MNKSTTTLLIDSVWPTFFGDGMAGIFLLQMLAWDKLDRDGTLPDELDLSRATQQPEIRAFIMRGFAYLSDLPALGENVAAFRHGQRLPEDLSEDDLRRLLAVLEAARGQQIDYREAVNEATRLEGKGDFYNSIPDEVSDLIVGLGNVGPDDTVYCPFNGSLRLAERSNRATSDVYFEGKYKTPLPHLINILLDSTIQVRFGDPITQPSWTEGGRLKVFDVVLANAPFGARYQRENLFDLYGRFPEKTFYGEVLHVRHVLAQCRGRAVVAVPNSLLFRTAAGEGQFKADLVYSRMLRAVIGLPASLLTSTNIALSLLVLDKENLSDTVLFIDASSEHFYQHKRERGSSDFGRRMLRNVDEILQIYRQHDTRFFAHEATREECESNDFNLLADRYVASAEDLRLEVLLSESEWVNLEEIAELLRPQSLKSDLDDNGIECFEVSVADIEDDGYIRRPGKSLAVKERALEKLRHQILKPNDILLAVKGSVGRVGLVPADLDQTWLANQSFQIVRLKPNNPYMHDAWVLYRYLCSPAGQSLIHSRSSGSGVRMIQTRDVKSLPVIVPSKKEQMSIAAEHRKIVSLYEEMMKLRAEANELEKKRWSI